MNELVPSMGVFKRSEQAIIKPMYVWKTGRTLFLSKKETIVADTFLATRSYAECSRALKNEGFKKSWQTCMRWLERKHIKDYLNESMDEDAKYRSLTKEKWYGLVVDHLSGVKKMPPADFYLMKLAAEYKGWGMPEVVAIGQINVTQANGNP